MRPFPGDATEWRVALASMVVLVIIIMAASGASEIRRRRRTQARMRGFVRWYGENWERRL